MTSLKEINGAAMGMALIFAAILIPIGGYGAIQASIQEQTEEEQIWDVYWEPGMGNQTSLELGENGDASAAVEIHHGLRQVLVVKVSDCVDTFQDTLENPATISWTVTRTADDGEGNEWSGTTECGGEETWEFAATDAPTVSEMLAKASKTNETVEELTEMMSETATYTINVTTARAGGVLPLSPTGTDLDATVEFHYHVWEPTVVERPEEELVR